mgnify:CR=1 FL=1
MNRGQIRTLVAGFCGDPSVSKFTVTQYDDAINRAQEQFAYDSKALFKDHPTITVVDGTATYDLPTDFWMEKQVTHKSVELQPVSRRTIQFDNGDDWTDDAGSPRKFIIDPEEGRKQIRLYPIPGADDAGANLILTYYPVPAEMSADSSTPLNSSSLMVQFHMGIANYAAYLLMKGIDITPEVAIKLGQLNKDYQASVDLAIQTFKNTATEIIKMRGQRRWF